jgi:hypothetical protein
VQIFNCHGFVLRTIVIECNSRDFGGNSVYLVFCGIIGYFHTFSYVICPSLDTFCIFKSICIFSVHGFYKGPLLVIFTLYFPRVEFADFAAAKWNIPFPEYFPSWGRKVIVNHVSQNSCSVNLGFSHSFLHVAVSRLRLKRFECMMRTALQNGQLAVSHMDVNSALVVAPCQFCLF